MADKSVLQQLYEELLASVRHAKGMLPVQDEAGLYAYDAEIERAKSVVDALRGSLNWPMEPALVTQVMDLYTHWLKCMERSRAEFTPGGLDEVIAQTQKFLNAYSDLSVHSEEAAHRRKLLN